MTSTGIKPVIEVIIVNYNAGDALTRCVQSVFDQQVPIHITVVDNLSSDNSIADLQDTVGPSDNITVIANDENLGFAKAERDVFLTYPCRENNIMYL